MFAIKTFPCARLRGFWLQYFSCDDDALDILGRAVGCVVKVSARGSEGRRFDTRLHSDSNFLTNSFG